MPILSLLVGKAHLVPIYPIVVMTILVKIRSVAAVKQHLHWEFTMFPKSLFGPLHPQWLLPMCRTAIWDIMNQKNFQLATYIFHPLCQGGDYGGSRLRLKSCPYWRDPKTKTKAPMCYIVSHFWPWCTLEMGIVTLLQHHQHRQCEILHQKKF